MRRRLRHGERGPLACVGGMSSPARPLDLDSGTEFVCRAEHTSGRGRDGSSCSHTYCSRQRRVRQGAARVRTPRSGEPQSFIAGHRVSNVHGVANYLFTAPIGSLPLSVPDANVTHASPSHRDVDLASTTCRRGRYLRHASLGTSKKASALAAEPPRTHVGAPPAHPTHDVCTSRSAPPSPDAPYASCRARQMRECTKYGPRAHPSRPPGANSPTNPPAAERTALVRGDVKTELHSCPCQIVWRSPPRSRRDTRIRASARRNPRGAFCADRDATRRGRAPRCAAPVVVVWEALIVRLGHKGGGSPGDDDAGGTPTTRPRPVRWCAPLGRSRRVPCALCVQF